MREKQGRRQKGRIELKQALPIIVALLITAVLVACGAGPSQEFSASIESAPAAASPLMEAKPAAASAPGTAQEIIVEKEVIKEVEVSTEAEALSATPAINEEQVALVAQNRIIVRTVQINLEVQDIANAIDVISESVKEQFGGWVVSSDRKSTHYGFLSVRVPATELDSSLEWMRGVGVNVLSEASTSTDVTDEYYDLRSRLKSLQATESALLKLLDRAEDVYYALEIQRELARLQVEVEAHMGRIKLLEETAAFSLVNISLNLVPTNMKVEAGPDKTFNVHEIARFRATFAPPEGIDDFTFTWDFGDGTPPVSGSGSAPTTEAGRRITATVNHYYKDDLDSPYIVEVKITGKGDAGIAEGKDTFIAAVSEAPAIVVFAGEYREIEEDEETTYSGSFTRPDGLTDYQYTWNFGDGSAIISGAPEEGATTVETSHIFDNHRPFPYTVTLTISAESEAGTIEGEGSFEVFVNEAQGFVISGWSASDTLKSAIRALSAVAQIGGTLVIWLAIFSPAWIAIGVIVFIIVRIRRRITRRPRQSFIVRNDAAQQQPNADE